MLDRSFFENEDAKNEDKKVSLFGRMSTLLVRNIQSLLDDVINRKTVKVSIEESNDKLTKNIVGQLHSVIYYLKYLAEEKPQSQKIQIKTTDLVSLNKNIEDILKRIEQKELKVIIPEITRVSGSVNVNNFPKQYDFDRIGYLLREIKEGLKNLRIEIPKQEVREIKIPEFPKEINFSGSAQIIDSLKEVRDTLRELPKQFPKAGKIEFPEMIRTRVENFPPQKYPMPVTHISINSLVGYAKSRNITVGTTPTPLPDEVLAYRRSIIVFNNHASATLFVGGSDVTTTNGLPVLAQTYSPALDAGPRLIIYGVVASGSADVRVFEVSDENSGK